MARFVILLMWVLSNGALAYDPMAPPGFNKGSIDNAMLGNSKKQPEKKAVAKSGYTLRQVVIAPTGKSAVINGYIVNEGSYLKDAYVKSIEANSVTLLVKGKVRQLTLEESVPRIRR